MATKIYLGKMKTIQNFPYFVHYTLQTAAFFVTCSLYFSTFHFIFLFIFIHYIMGVFFSSMKIFKRSNLQAPPLVKNEFSWEKRKQNSLPEDFSIVGLCGDCVVKGPGSVSGEQFLIRDCRYSSIYVLDYSNCVTIDDCFSCTLAFGPSERSVFVRDCTSCVIIAACEQFRMRDCKGLKVFLYCATNPIIESSSDIEFSCFTFSYEGIKDHFKKCKLNVWNNNWYQIHDYTPSAMTNWTFGKGIADLQMPVLEEFERLGVGCNAVKCPIPFTTGFTSKLIHYRNCLVAFCDEHSAKLFVNAVLDTGRGISVIKSKQFEISAEHAESMFLTSPFVQAMQNGAIIGLHVYGKDVIEMASRIIANRLETTLYYVSPTSNMATHQVQTFFAIANLQIQEMP